MYCMTGEIPFVQCGPDGKMKIHEAAEIMINCCQFQEYQEVEFCKYLRENNLVIFLFSIQIDILCMPEFRETVDTAVKIYGCKSVCGLRRITMRDGEGKLCLIANATGAFFDLKANRAIKPDLDKMHLKLDEAEPMECLPRKIPIPAAGGTVMEKFKVTPSMLDINGHLTSSEYLALASDVLPDGFEYNRVRMEYKQQAKVNDIISMVVYLNESGTAVVDLKDTEGISFAAAEFSTAVLSGV